MYKEIPDGVIEICLHVFEDQVEIFVILGSDDLFQLDHIAVLDLIQ